MKKRQYKVNEFVLGNSKSETALSLDCKTESELRCRVSSHCIIRSS